jgi:hypothetical protein
MNIMLHGLKIAPAVPRRYLLFIEKVFMINHLLVTRLKYLNS